VIALHRKITHKNLTSKK